MSEQSSGVSMHRTSRRTDAYVSSALPTVVVSGEPDPSPISPRSRLITINVVVVVLTAPASLRRAWLVNRTCRPTWPSPASPAGGTSAATESTTMMSRAPERMSVWAISRACTPLPG
jgi:hypothetical protein